MDILYHYCPTASFHSIVANRSIWLSSLSQSNDYMEGKLASHAIERLALKDKLKDYDVQHLREFMTIIETNFDGLGFCLSAAPDLLSQWRGYAGDATGVAIGFSKDFLCRITNDVRNENFGMILKDVAYSSGEHDTLVQPTYLEVRQHIHDGASMPLRANTVLDPRTEEERINYLTGMAKIYQALKQVYRHLFLLKSDAFKEELEWRLISSYRNDPPEECSYRLRNDRVVPYRIVDISNTDIPRIVKVILGPKHPTPIYVVKNFLISCGFGNVEVIQSNATYR